MRSVYRNLVSRTVGNRECIQIVSLGEFKTELDFFASASLCLVALYCYVFRLVQGNGICLCLFEYCGNSYV